MWDSSGLQCQGHVGVVGQISWPKCTPYRSRHADVKCSHCEWPTDDAHCIALRQSMNHPRTERQRSLDDGPPPGAGAEERKVGSGQSWALRGQDSSFNSFSVHELTGFWPCVTNRILIDYSTEDRQQDVLDWTDSQQCDTREGG